MSFAEEIAWTQKVLTDYTGATEACGTLQAYLYEAFPYLSLKQAEEWRITLDTEVGFGGQQSTQDLATGYYDGTSVRVYSEHYKDSFFSIPVSVYWV